MKGGRRNAASALLYTYRFVPGFGSERRPRLHVSRAAVDRNSILARALSDRSAFTARCHSDRSAFTARSSVASRRACPHSWSRGRFPPSYPLRGKTPHVDVLATATASARDLPARNLPCSPRPSQGKQPVVNGPTSRRTERGGKSGQTPTLTPYPPRTLPVPYRRPRNPDPTPGDHQLQVEHDLILHTSGPPEGLSSTSRLFDGFADVNRRKTEVNPSGGPAVSCGGSSHVLPGAGILGCGLGRGSVGGHTRL